MSSVKVPSMKSNVNVIMAGCPDGSDNERDFIDKRNDSNHESDRGSRSAISNAEKMSHSEKPSSSSHHPNPSSHLSGEGAGSSRKGKESNPYSFKHFLTGGKQNVGARLRHDTHSSSNNESSESITTDPPNDSACSRSNRNLILNNPELASGLPDFVQDHLIMEQCFLEPNSNTVSNSSCSLENSHIYQLENAILNSTSSQGSSNALRSANANDIPFDLTSTMPSERRDQEAPLSIPLDLPSFHSSSVRSGRPRDPPLDLPTSSQGAGSENTLEVGSSKSLPDFLSDGPIHQRRTDDSVESDGPALPYSPHELSPVEIRLLQAENLRLRKEVEWLSSVLKESNDRLERRERRHQATTVSLEKELESIRDNLRRTMERAIVAEATVCQLQQEGKSSKASVHNSHHAEQRSASCSKEGDGERTMSRSASHQDPNQRLGNEIQDIASTAEMSLRQLINNMETLRLIANRLEKSTDEAAAQEGCSKDLPKKDLNET